MKYYVQFLKVNGINEIDEMLGSDGVFILDGRNNMNTMINDSKKRINQLKNVQSGIVGFKIHKGERFSNSKCLYRQLI